MGAGPGGVQPRENFTSHLQAAQFSPARGGWSALPSQAVSLLSHLHPWPQVAPPIWTVQLSSPNLLSCPCESGYFWKSLWDEGKGSHRVLPWMGVLDSSGRPSLAPSRPLRTLGSRPLFAHKINRLSLPSPLTSARLVILRPGFC